MQKIINLVNFRFMCPKRQDLELKLLFSYDFSKAGLHLNFCMGVHIYMHY
jgi:hypothetical protein